MENEFIKLDELINQLPKENITNKNDSFIDDIKTNINLYQIQSKINESSCVIKFIGNPVDIIPTYIIHEFKFKNYDCKIISYVLSDADLECANNDSEFKIIGLLITDNDKVKCVIRLSFYSSIHIDEKKHINEYIDKNIEGFYQFNLIANDNKTIIGDIMHKFIGKTKSIYKLTSLLSDEKLNYLWT